MESNSGHSGNEQYIHSYAHDSIVMLDIVFNSPGATTEVPFKYNARQLYLLFIDKPDTTLEKCERN